MKVELAWTVNSMSGFSLTAYGCLEHDPEISVTEEGTYSRFCLTAEEYTEEDEQGRSDLVIQSIWFVATHLLGAAISDSARKGDQLFVVGKIRQRHWTAKGRNEGYTLVVTGFRFGGRRSRSREETSSMTGGESKPPLRPVHEAEPRL